MHELDHEKPERGVEHLLTVGQGPTALGHVYLYYAKDNNLGALVNTLRYRHTPPVYLLGYQLFKRKISTERMPLQSLYSARSLALFWHGLETQTLERRSAELLVVKLLLRDRAISKDRKD